MRVLLALEQGRTTLSAELERARRQTTDERDRALVLELTAGTLRWRNELDAALAACSRRGIADLNAQVRAVLRLGAYQIRHLDRIPSHAAVHESVELVRGLGQTRATGFVNAVLRSLVRKKNSIALPQRPGPDASRSSQVRYLTISLSHPEWLVARWLDRYGFDAAARWCEFNNAAPDLTLRVGPADEAEATMAELRLAGVEASPARWVRGAIRVPAGDWSRVPHDMRGRLFIQDEASQIVALTAAAAPNERVLDACAAPGGKTVIMAHRMTGGTGRLIAADHRPSRVRVLTAALARAHVTVPVVQLDATQPLPFGPVFDRILIDAPCSGLGTVRRDPDVKWRRSADDQPGFAAGQTLMLAAAAGALGPGGTLVYATCSSEPEENEQVVDQFLASHPDFALVRANPGASVHRGSDLVDDRGLLRTLPFRDGLDAYFCALLVRRRAA